MRILDYKNQLIGTNKKILLVEPDNRIVLAAKKLLAENIITPVLLGDRKDYERHGNIEGLEFIPYNTKDYVDHYYELRKHKNITRQQAADEVNDRAVIGCLLVKQGVVDGLVCGCTWPTAKTLRAALRTIRKGLAFSYFIMRTQQGDYLFADCAFNIKPSEEELSQIAYHTAEEASWLGLEPKIAMLSFSTYGSAKHPEQERIANATKKLQELIIKNNKNYVAAGEMQVDAAMDKQTAQIKCPDSPIQGDATVFIFPDLNAANIGYKLVQRFTHCEAIGPIISGFTKPVNDLSRGASVEDIIDTCYITAWQSLHY